MRFCARRDARATVPPYNRRDAFAPPGPPRRRRRSRGPAPRGAQARCQGPGEAHLREGGRTHPEPGLRLVPPGGRGRAVLPRRLRRREEVEFDGRRRHQDGTDAALEGRAGLRRVPAREPPDRRGDRDPRELGRHRRDARKGRPPARAEASRRRLDPRKARPDRPGEGRVPARRRGRGRLPQLRDREPLRQGSLGARDGRASGQQAGRPPRHRVPRCRPPGCEARRRDEGRPGRLHERRGRRGLRPLRRAGRLGRRGSGPTRRRRGRRSAFPPGRT